jgi:hypothetical protein
MRPLVPLISILFVLSISTGLAADRKPADAAAPVFRVFASESSGGSGAPQINLSGKQPLMVISTVASVQLSTDRKAVRVTLTPSDARRFADITRKHSKDLLILEANGKVLEAMQVSSPVTNGTLEFTYPDDATVADYLKKRFRLK